jgi:transcriptional regulator with XRE-family HTH domain
MKEVIGRNIRYYRHQLGWSQEKLAVRSRLSSNYVSALERGTVNISVNNLEKIAEALKVKPFVLLYDNAHLLSKEDLHALNSFGKK